MNTAEHPEPIYTRGWWSIYETAIGTYRATFHYGDEQQDEFFDTLPEAIARTAQ